MKTVKTIAVLLSAVLLLGGCQAHEKADSDEQGDINYPDSDYMWNPDIMETENGFYISGTSALFLQYHDKQSGNEIMLCSKPECPHDGRETCTATYKTMNVSNAVLYNNFIYFAGVDSDGENITVSLYKVAPDGSSLDRLFTFYSVKDNLNANELCLYNPKLLIHRGYVYINIELYRLEEAGQYSGFIGGGFYRGDLRTGSASAVIPYNDFWSDKRVNGDIYPCGDYICYVNLTNGKEKYYRLGLTSDSPEQVFSDNDNLAVFAAESNKLYVQEYPEGEKYKILDDNKIIEYDSETMQKIREYTVCAGAKTVYDGKIYVTPYLSGDVTEKYIKVYKDGEKIFETTDVPGDEITRSTGSFGLSFSNGKIYVDKRRVNARGVEYFSCGTENFLDGNITWKKEYDTEQFSKNWEEYADSRAMNGMLDGYYSYGNF